MTDCQIVGPYYPAGDVDWTCRTHNVLCELRDPATYGRSDVRREDVRCPMDGETARPAPEGER